MGRERDALWDAWQEIGARNADKDPDEVERDVAAAIEEVRAEARAKVRRGA
jgi:hypothetical protein